MEQPGTEENNQGTEYKSGRASPATRFHKQRIEEDLHHEVLPIDINPPPVVVEPVCKIVESVRLGKVEPEQAHEANDEMK